MHDVVLRLAVRPDVAQQEAGDVGTRIGHGLRRRRVCGVLIFVIVYSTLSNHSLRRAPPSPSMPFIPGLFFCVFATRTKHRYIHSPRSTGGAMNAQAILCNARTPEDHAPDMCCLKHAALPFRTRCCFDQEKALLYGLEGGVLAKCKIRSREFFRVALSLRKPAVFHCGERFFSVVKHKISAASACWFQVPPCAVRSQAVLRASERSSPRTVRAARDDHTAAAHSHHHAVALAPFECFQRRPRYDDCRRSADAHDFLMGAECFHSNAIRMLFESHSYEVISTTR